MDTQPWNLARGLAGVALLTGCGSRTIGANDDSGTGSTSISATTMESGTEDPPECVVDSDCGDSFYYCVDGTCEYVPHHDGHLDYSENYWYPDCFSDRDCGYLEQCTYDYCVATSGLPQCPDAPDPASIPLAIPGATLALSFVEVGGAERAVAVTADSIYTFDPANLDAPSVTPTGLALSSPVFVAAGDFDGDGDDDLMLAHNDGLTRHDGDGLGTFAPPAMVPLVLPGTRGLTGADLDGAPPTELLVWGEAGAAVVDGPPLSDEATEALTARGGLDPGGSLITASQWRAFGPDGALVGALDTLGHAPWHLSTLPPQFAPGDIATETVTSSSDWTVIRLLDVATNIEAIRWGVIGQVQSLATGDFDGDGDVDLALLVNGELWIHRDILGERCALPLILPADGVELARGDHDADGDDELSVRLVDGTVMLFDGP